MGVLELGGSWALTMSWMVHIKIKVFGRARRVHNIAEYRSICISSDIETNCEIAQLNAGRAWVLWDYLESHDLQRSKASLSTNRSVTM